MTPAKTVAGLARVQERWQFARSLATPATLAVENQLEIIADPASDFKKRSWARQSSGASAVRPKSGDTGYAEG